MTTDSASSNHGPAKLSISLNGTFVKILLAITATGAIGGGSYVVGRQQQEHVAASRAEGGDGSLSEEDMKNVKALPGELKVLRAEFESVRTQADYAERLAQASKNALDSNVKEIGKDVTDIKVMLAALKSRLETEDRINATKPK